MKKINGKQQANISWEITINDLACLYRNVERDLQKIPVFSIAPLFVMLWLFIKIPFAIVFEIMFFIPMNFVILVNNFSFKKEKYRSFLWGYLKYIWLWLWRGEALYLPVAVVRSLAKLIIFSHINRNLELVKKEIYFDENLTEKYRSEILTQINHLVEHWKTPKCLYVFSTYLLPLSGSLIGIYNLVFPKELPEWSISAGYMLIIYILGFLITAFMVKRSILLRCDKKNHSYPGAIQGDGHYKEERDILESVGVMTKEFPWDLILPIFALILAYFLNASSAAAYLNFGMVPLTLEESFNIQYQLAFQGAILSFLTVFLIYRRKTLGRE